MVKASCEEKSTESRISFDVCRDHRIPAPLDWSQIKSAQIEEPYENVDDASFLAIRHGLAVSQWDLSIHAELRDTFSHNK